MSDNKKTVAILSMQQIDNYGSLLQAYSLKHILESLNCKVSFLDIEVREEDNSLMQGLEEDHNSEVGSKSLVEKVFDKYVFARIRNKTIKKKQSALYAEFRKSYFDTLSKDDTVDVCVIGSDEVFNCMQKSFWGFSTQLFGNVKEADKVITYAACCGFTEYENLPAGVEEKIRDSFKKISAFSVRDANSYEFVRKLTDDTDIRLNLDPALLGNFDREIEAETKVNVLPDHYCLVYAYTNRIYKDEDIQSIKEFCKKSGLTPIAVGMPQMWIKNFYAASPFELLSIFKRADFIITDTFHGAIFSAKYAPKFAIISRDSNRNKLMDLIKRIHLDEHSIDSLEKLESVADVIHDKQTFQNMIENEYGNTIEYFGANL